MSYLREVATAVALLLPFILLNKFWRPNSKDSIVNDDDDSTSEVDAIPDSTNPSGSFPSVEYDVFLSFRGPDTRKQFTDFLYHFLCYYKIHTFRDDDELRKGKEIGPNLLRAIDQSKIYVPIISSGYADSKWCLMELAEIVRRQEEDPRRIILPIFYMVDPSDVRHQTGCYKKAFRKHANKFDGETIQNWKDALKKVGDLKGWHIGKDDKQGAIADEVSADIWSHISKENLILETDELVGIDDHITAVLEKLSLDSENVTMVGLYGMGGIGKTTTAKAVYNKISSCFDRCCFIDNIRETQDQKDGVVVLQKKLVSEILRIDSGSVGFNNDSGGRKTIKERVSRFKILVVLDDVDEKFKFEDMLGSPKDFISQSRFIITSRSMRVLGTLNENQCKLYEVGSMSKPRSLELFSKHAFKKNTPPSDYETLANDVVDTTAGLPLTLKVIGSILFKQEIAVWEDTLEQLRKTLNLDEVYDRLKISYDALKPEAKEIFLDIACFFIGKNKEKPYYMWTDCNFYPASNIIFLIQRCMIQVGDDDKFKMHDQLRDMGREIVRREDVRPWKRSRIWSREEGIDLLLNKKGSSKVKAISMVPPLSPDFVKYEFKSECFLNLSELRYLHASSAMLTGDLNNLLPNLKWLELPFYYHGEDDPPLTNFTMKNLIIVILEHSSITADDWGGWSHMMKMAERLKVVRLSSNDSSSEKLSGCWRFPKSIEVLSMIAIEMDEVDIGELKKLKTLVLELCKIQKISGGTFGMLKGLRELCLEFNRGTNLREVVADIGQLSSLKVLKTTGAKEVEINEFPLGLKELSTSSRIPNLSQLLDLEVLRVYVCKDGFDMPPASPSEDESSVWWKVSKLKSLQLQKTRINVNVVDDASSGGHLPRYLLPTSLTSLNIDRCTEPTWLPGIENLENLTSLEVNGIFQTLGGDLDGLQGLRSLEILWIRKVNGLARIKGLKDLLCSSTCKLREFYITECPDLIELLPCELGGQTVVVPSMAELTIRDCPRLEVGPMIRSLPKFPMLKKLDLAVANITKEEDLDAIGSLEELVRLKLVLDDTCSGIERIASLSKLQKLTTLVVKVPSLREIEGLAELKSLQRLILVGCTSLGRLPLEKLKELDIGGCPDLAELVQTVVAVPSLVELTIRDCPRLEVGPMIQSLPKFPMLNKLTLSMVNITKEDELEVLGSLEELDRLVLKLDDTCSSIERISSLSKLQKLTTLVVEVPSLREIEGLAELKSLQSLDLQGCTSLERLWPDQQQLGSLKKLNEIDIRGCKSLSVDHLSALKTTLPAKVIISWPDQPYIRWQELM
uniref:Flax rust resistance protein n=1 Tax=Linum usitatissimum TaxID=4006 RepID=A0A8A1NF86_LINUS|nr:flax rust resistance protein [Linum usitatissimum]